MSAENDDYKKLLLEADLTDDSEDLASLLNELEREPHRYGRVEPPAGYENHLLAALRTRLPLDQKPALADAPKKESIWSFFCSRRAAWSFSGAMAAVVAVLAFQSVRNVTPPASTDDYLAQTARRGNSEAVERWVASVADLGVQVQDTHQASLAEELSKEDPKVASRALDAVAKSLGVKSGI
jgi:hypothetical protein